MTTKDRRLLESRLPFYIVGVKNFYPTITKIVRISRSAYYSESGDSIPTHTHPNIVFNEKEAIAFKINNIKKMLPIYKEIVLKMETEILENPTFFC